MVVSPWSIFWLYIFCLAPFACLPVLLYHVLGDGAAYPECWHVEVERGRYLVRVEELRTHGTRDG